MIGRKQVGKAQMDKIANTTPNVAPPANTSPVYAVADELEAIARQPGHMGVLMEQARQRFKHVPSMYLNDPRDWPPRPGVLGVWVSGEDIVCRWVCPHTGVKTSAHRISVH